MAESNLHKLSKRGVSVWIDYLSRDMLEQGELARMMKEDAVAGLTSNPTIFQKAISQGDAYDAQLKELLEHETDPKEIFLQLSARDVDAALELFAPVHEQSPQDGFVSWEVDPTLAYDREGTFAEAMRLHAWIDKPNLYVKIPATKPGLGAIEDCIAHGKSINVTLIFSLQRYREVVEAYLRGLERLVAGGGNPAGVHSVASFFVSRVDTEADRRLEEIGSKDALALRGRLAVANAKLAYEHYGNAFSDPRWQYLAGKGANPQRCLWASTSTKNPAYRDVIYVEELIGSSTVNTMPEETIHAFQDHGKVRGDTVEEDLEAAHKLLKKLAKAGVDYDDVDGDARARGRAEVRRLVRAAARGRPVQARPGHRLVMSDRRELIDRIWERDPTVWTGADEAKWLGWLDEPRQMRERVAELAAFADGVAGRGARRRRPARHGRLEPRPGGAAADVRLSLVPRPRHDTPAGDPRARVEDRRRAHAVRLRLEVGLDPRDALAHGLLLGEDGRQGRAVRRHHRPGLRARADGAGAAVPACVLR